MGSQSSGGATAGSTAGAEIWGLLLADLQTLDGSLQLAAQSFGGEGLDKSLSATTKRRMGIRSLAGISDGRKKLQEITLQLAGLREASHNWQAAVAQAESSRARVAQQHLQVVSELQSTMDQLRTLQAEKHVAVRDLDAARKQVQQLETEKKTIAACLQQREDELETAQFAAQEAGLKASRAMEEAGELRRLAQEAERDADEARSALEGLRAEEQKGRDLVDKQQEVLPCENRWLPN
ncbi:unnamed protein product [Ostreobium quekettii]|uniref:Uncharacterized protein n=1 Tax=Ostreobium quekettii TaxID=121088 RepID=A0A8S1IU85_9CHLO|nr:unnamed protein product [Ostreobium quekettii]|eukprot:evm.model.scf_40.4 EVM.evm.TU.scf_40.4   scf_40:24728-29250(+)